MLEQAESIQFETSTKDKKLNIILDMSSFDLFQTCKQRYNYRHNRLKAQPIEHKAKALDLGGLAHEGFEAYYNALKRGEHYNDRIEKALSRIRVVSADTDVCSLKPEEIPIVLRAVEESCDYWRFEDEQMEILEVEQAFAYVVYEDDYIRIILTGKIDILVNIPAVGRNAGYSKLPIDHKTYQREFETPRLSNQFINYANALQSNYLVVNKVGLHVAGTKLKPEDRFKRIPLSYDPLMFEEWKDDIIHTILHEYVDCVATNVWPRNMTSCFKYNRKCEYYEICETSGVEAKLYKLESDMMTVSPWDVTAKLNKGEE